MTPENELYVPKAEALFTPSQFNYLYSQLYNSKHRRIIDHTGDVLGKPQQLNIDYAEVTQSKTGKPIPTDPRILILRSFDVEDDINDLDDAKHEIHITADGTLCASGGKVALSYERATEFIHDTMPGLLNLIRDMRDMGW